MSLNDNNYSEITFDTSLKTNLLDLGIWNSMQSILLKRIVGDNVQSLVSHTCDQLWTDCDSLNVFEKVYQPWLRVLQIILSNNGDNRLIDAHRKELFHLQNMPCRDIITDSSTTAPSRILTTIATMIVMTT